MLLVGKAVFTVISFNAVEGVQSYATCSKICFPGIYLNAVEGVQSVAFCMKSVFFYIQLKEFSQQVSCMTSFFSCN